MKRDKYGAPEFLGGLSRLVFIAIMVTFVLFLIAYYSRVVNNSRREMARNFVSIFIPTALDHYKDDNGEYPTSMQGLEALWKAPYGAANWNGPYITPSPLKDPWGNDYQYVHPGLYNENSFDIWSLGGDSSNDNDDIRNWNLEEPENGHGG